jgi:hypothetical protein
METKDTKDTKARCDIQPMFVSLPVLDSYQAVDKNFDV